MPAKKKPTNGHGKLNGKKTVPSPSDPHPEVVCDSKALISLDRRNRAIAMFLEGVRNSQIATELGISERWVRHYVFDARIQLTSTKKEFYDNNLGLLLNDAFDNLAAHSELLADDDFLRTAAPERLENIGRNYGIVADKIFALLTSFGGRSAVAG